MDNTENDDDGELYEEYEDEPKAVVPVDTAKKAMQVWGQLRANITQSQNDDGSIKTKIVARKTAFVSALIHLDGKNFDFTGREYLEPVYDRNDSEVLLKTARQVEKSTFLSNNLLINSVIIPYNKSLYVSPSHMQTRQFSSEKLKPIIERSPLISTYFQDSSVSQQVFEKGFLNGAFIFLRSCYRSADRARGISARNLCCVWGNCTVNTIERGVIQLRDLRPGEHALSCDLSNGTTVYSKVKRVWKTGIKSTLKVTVASGRSIVLTPDHKLYSWDGWKEAGDLKVGNFLLTEAPRFSEKDLIDPDVCFFLGLILGDGSHEKRGQIYFRNTNSDLFDLALKCAIKIDRHLSIQENTHHSSLSGKVLTEKRIYFPRQGAMENYLEELGLMGQKTSEKEVTFFQKIGREQAIRILSGLFVTDGCVSSGFNTKNKKSPFFVSASFISTSKKLCISVSTLLRMLGIKSHFRKKQIGNDISVLSQYSVTVRDVYNFKKFIELIPMPTKENQVESAKSILSQMPGQTSKADLVPVSNKELIQILKNKLGRGALTRFKEKTGIYIGSNSSRAQSSVVSQVLDFLGDYSSFPSFCNEGSWEEITKIETHQKCDVFDFTIESSGCIYVDSLLTHNCDELQDFLIDQIPVIRECTSHFPDSCTMMAGTPKSLNNPIEVYWKTTSQNEWLVPCTGCGKWNFLDEKNIAPTSWYTEGKLPPGPVCKYCGKPINVKSGRWVSMCSTNPMKGYRIPQLMVPWICGLYNQWLKLLWKRDNYPISQFYNEVLGISYDSSSTPITQEELVSICGDYSLWDLDRLTSDQINFGRGCLLTAGVDWGEGLDGSEKSPSGKLRPASYTVLTIGYYHTQTQFKVIAIKKFTGKETDPDYVVRYIAQVCKTLSIDLVGVDWGHGWGVNNHLVRLLGGGNHVVQFQYLPKLKMKMKWDPVGYRYHLMRNFIMSELFYDMKHGNLCLPRWSEFEPFSKDILAIYTEYNEFRKEMKYDHRISEPDDGFHSLLFSKLVADIQLGRANRFTEAATNYLGE